jgi:hypothetical protein
MTTPAAQIVQQKLDQAIALLDRLGIDCCASRETS